MALDNLGLNKLVEECGELITVAAKKMARMQTDEHWDDAGGLASRLEDEIADVRAATTIVVENFGLNHERINARAAEKLALFRSWMDEH